MPLYEYKCDKCGDVFEVMQKFVDTPLHEHPECGGKVHRLISRSALQFKGSGWYVNDYAKGSGGSSSSDNSDKSDNSTKSDGSGQSAKNDGAPAKSSNSESSSKPAASTTSTGDTKSNS